MTSNPTSALDKLTVSVKEVQDYMEVTRSTIQTAQCHISLMSARLEWIDTDDTGSSKANPQKVVSELELALKQAQLKEAKAQLYGEKTENALAEALDDLGAAKTEVARLESLLNEAQKKSGITTTNLWSLI